MKEEYVDQRTYFVNRLYNEMKKQDQKVKGEFEKLASLAKEYIADGLSEKEAIELLVVDGICREAASSYLEMAKDNIQDEISKKAGSDYYNNDLDEEYSSGLMDGEEIGNHYSFIFQDSYGNTFSSYDIDEVITANSKKEALKIASSFIGDENPYEIEKIISIEKID